MKRYRKSLLTFDGLYYVNTDMKFSGYAAYDCTMDYELSKNGIIDIYYIDLINRMPIAELIKAIS